MTTKTKLTPAQLRVLRELCKPNARARMGSRGGAWRVDGFKNASAQVEALIKLGLLKYNVQFAPTATVTPAAHALLAAIDGAK